MIDLTTAIERVGEFRLHPLGFFYLLGSQRRGISHRVHVWLPTIKGKAQSLRNVRHQHTFDIRSAVWLGCIGTELFSFTVEPNGGVHEFEVTYEGSRSRLTATGRSGILEIIASFQSDIGREYFLKAGIIHRVSIISRPCVTFLTITKRRIRIFSYGDDVEEPAFERRLVNAAEKRGIERVLQIIEQGSVAPN